MIYREWTMKNATSWLCGVALVLYASQAQASGTFGEVAKDLAKDVKIFLDNQGKNKIAIGQFLGRGDLGRFGSASPLLHTALEYELKLLGVTVVAVKGDYELTGEYENLEDIKTGRHFVQVKLELRDRVGASHHFSGNQKIDGKETAVKYVIKNEDDLAKLLGPPSVYVSPLALEIERIAAYGQAIDKPNPIIEQTRVLAGKGAPFSLEILTAPPKPGGGKHKRDDYVTRNPVTDKESGLAFVPIARNEVYAVRIINDADFDVAVDLRIDGLSVYHASDFKDEKTGLPKDRFIIVEKKTPVFIPGWFINLSQADEFLVTEYAKSEAGKFGNAANVGTITATFHAAWDPKGKPPADEPRNPSELAQSADATGRGDRVTADYKLLDRTIGVFRGAVSVRYVK